MNTTIAVAIITALATISGGSIAGVITLVTQNQQAQSQRTAENRQIRRDVYVRFLTAWDKQIDELLDVWRKPPTELPPESFLEITELDVIVNSVYLEGPGNVRDSAVAMMTWLNKEMDMIRKYAVENVGGTDRLISFSSLSFDELDYERAKVKFQFTMEASAALK